MDAMSATAGSQAIAAAAPPPPPPPPAATDDVAKVGGSSTPSDHALFQGQGGKNGILKRMETQDIETVQSELGIKAAAVADDVLARRTTTPADVEPVDTVPVEAANVDPPSEATTDPAPRRTAPFDVSDIVPDPREAAGDGVVTITEFVQAGVLTDTEA